MNQILVTERIYVTPELKRKKKIYRFNFLLSIFLVCSLFSYYIYAEYDRNKNEEVSQEILANINLEYYDEEAPKNTGVRMEDNVLIVTLNQRDDRRQEIDITKFAESIKQQVENKHKEVYTTENGETYSIDAVINIPSLEINYPVLDKTSEELLKISITKVFGCKPNDVRKLCNCRT